MRVRRPDVFLFDLGGVLIENAGFAAFQALHAEPRPSLPELKSRWLGSPSVRLFEVGGSTPESFADAFVAEYPVGLTGAAFLDAFIGWPKDFYPGALDLVDRLRADGVRVACLSNANALHWGRYAEALDEHFDVVLASHLVGVLKPDAACFERALAACDASPEDVVFFDDSEANVEAARAIGMHAFLVEGIDGVRGVLADHGW
jgi:epoxide hydrolase-like predicted phosphatase